jgi:hypothetical protein
MNMWKILMYIFFLQLGITVVTFAQIPLTCNSDGTACVYFDADTLRSTEMEDIISNQVNENQYRSTQIKTDIFRTDVLTATSTVLNIITNVFYMSLFGLYAFITFIFGNNGVAVALGVGMQTLIYIFYARAFADVIKLGGKGEI